MKLKDSHKNSPLVSVIMPVFNRERFVGEAVQSILNQRYSNFELIIVDGGSKDKSIEIIKNFNARDNRIKIFNQMTHGIPSARNEGIRYAQGKYIAIMDSDDISLPERLTIQVEYMEKHPDIGVCGSSTRTFGEFVITRKFPTSDLFIKASLLFKCPLAHPTVILRKEIIDLYNIHYNQEFAFAEDYELWVKLSRITKFSNIDKILLRYRIHPNSVSTLFTQQQQKFSDAIYRLQLDALKIPLDEKKIALHQSLTAPGFEYNDDYLISINQWLIELIEANKKERIYDDGALVKVISDIWFDCCIKAKKSGVRSWQLFSSSTLSEYIAISKIQKMEWLITCMVRIEHIVKFKRLLRI